MQTVTSNQDEVHSEARKAELLAAIAGAKAELAASTPKQAAKPSFAGTYPPNATAAEKMLLDAIHQLKSKPKEGGKVYDVQGTYGKALYSHFYAMGLDRDTINRHLDPAVKRGIVTTVARTWYYDAREKPLSVLRQAAPIAADIKAAAAKAFV
jgi:hypothetical protein